VFSQTREHYCNRKINYYCVKSCASVCASARTLWKAIYIDIQKCCYNYLLFQKSCPEVLGLDLGLSRIMPGLPKNLGVLRTQRLFWKYSAWHCLAVAHDIALRVIFSMLATESFFALYYMLAINYVLHSTFLQQLLLLLHYISLQTGR